MIYHVFALPNYINPTLIQAMTTYIYRPDAYNQNGTLEQKTIVQVTVLIHNIFPNLGNFESFRPETAV